MQLQSLTPCVVVTALPASRARPAEEKKYIGDGRDILLQGFHWQSHAGVAEPKGGRKSWYRIVQDNATRIKAAGFSWVWFPPPSDSLAPEGYMPRRWNVMDTTYGTLDELRQAIGALKPVQAMVDIVINHRVGV